ncbi:MAG: membrane protein insertase YidC [Rhizobiaceae bacterium]|nr:membrane protein insertase YidC [Rhizobiaceae bacterium]
MDGNNKNTFLAIALSIAVIVVWQFFYINPKLDAEREAAQLAAEQTATEQAASQPSTSSGSNGNVPANNTTGETSVGSGANVPGTQTTSSPAISGDSRDAVLAKSKRVTLETDSLIGSINLKGARIDDLKLKNYRETIQDGSPLIELLSPSETKDAFFAEFGWVAGTNAGEVPGPNTMWEISAGRTLTAERPVTLKWSNKNGLTFLRTIAIDENYMFTLTDEVKNASSSAVSLSPYGRITRFGKPEIQGIYVLHEGLIGIFGEDANGEEQGLQEYTYSEIEDDKQLSSEIVKTGWVGITDKYWAAALLPSGEFKPRFSYFSDGRPRYQTDFLAKAIEIGAGKTATVEQRMFAGAKKVDIVDGYNDTLGLDRFDRLIDWGWFYFITKPMFQLLSWLNNILGNFGLAILATTVIVKAIFFPLANLSYASMAKMKKLQPEMAEIKERHGDDKAKQQQAMMALYKKEKINPAAGCWPELIQIPVFFSLYKVIYITLEMRHAPFFGWIQDLAAPDPTSIFNLFGLIPFEVPAFLMIGVWPLLMGITMFLQMRMNPTPPDPTQQMIFTWMPVMFTFMLASFPAGLVIYWAWNNFLSIIQQGLIMKRHGVKVELFDNLKGLFDKKKPEPPKK